MESNNFSWSLEHNPFNASIWRDFTPILSLLTAGVVVIQSQGKRITNTEEVKIVKRNDQL